MTNHKEVTIADAPSCLNTGDKAMWVIGYNECLAKHAAPATVGQAEYRRGVMEAFHQANMANANRQGRTAEETCSYLVRSLADLANGGVDPSPTPPAGEGQEPVAIVDAVWMNGKPSIWISKLKDVPVGSYLYDHPAPQAAQVTHWPDGTARDPRDIASDPSGVLVHEPGMPLIAAQPAQDEREAFDADDWKNPDPSMLSAVADGLESIEDNENAQAAAAYIRAALSTSLMEGDALDAKRFRYLTEDIADRDTRWHRNDLLRRMGMMSYSAACTDIDAAIAAMGKGGEQS